MSMHPQLPLSFDNVDARTFESFHAGENALLVDRLKQFSSANNNDQQILIWGGASVGKSHLLNAACHQAASHGFRIAYLPAGLIQSPVVFDGLEYCNLVCVDDVHLMPKSRELEIGLFNLINTVRQNDQRLLFSSTHAPANLSILLPDLQTRLEWGACYSVHPLGSAHVREALREQARQAGLIIESNVLDYLLNNFPRDIGTQTAQLQQLDKASMQTRRKITIPLVREVLISDAV